MKSLECIGMPNHAITRCGKVYSHISKRFLSPSVRGEYLSIGLYHDRKRKSFAVHRLVALVYLDNPENKPCVNHIDGDKFNNHVSNLEWCTHSENAIHAVETGLKGQTINHYRSLDESIVKSICSLLQDGFRVKDVAESCGVKSQDVSDIKSGKNYQDISSEFDLTSIPFRQRISTEKIIKICEMLQDRTPMAKIKAEVGVNLGTVRRIKRRECNTNFSKNYTW